jgi:Holliday junction resolvasome RuvABC endonuclease subunit
MYNCENLSIAIEDVFVRNNIKTCIILAKNASAVAAILEKELDVQVSWVLPRSWRANLNMKKQKRNNAKADSLHYIPLVAKDLDKALDRLGRLDHITDSAGIALYLIDEARRNSDFR